MRRFYLIGFLALVVFDTLSQLSFKLAAEGAAPPSLDPHWLLRVVFEPWTYGALLGYLGAFIVWMTLLKHAPIGPAFAASHMEIVTVLLISVTWLGESLSIRQVIGSVLILLGIAVLAGRARDQVAAQPGRP